MDNLIVFQPEYLILYELYMLLAIIFGLLIFAFSWWIEHYPSPYAFASSIYYSFTKSTHYLDFWPSEIKQRNIEQSSQAENLGDAYRLKPREKSVLEELQHVKQQLAQKNAAFETLEKKYREKVAVLDSINEINLLEKNQLEKLNQRLTEQESQLKNTNEELLTTEEALRQQMEEMKRVQDQMDLNQQKLKENEAWQKELLEKLRKQEKDLTQKNEFLRKSEQQLKEKVSVLDTIQEINQLKQIQLERINTKLKQHQQTLKERNDELKTSEEELLQNMEEMQTIQTILEEKQQELLVQNQTLKNKEEIIQKNNILLRRQNENIYRSLNYAHSIQSTIFPRRDKLSKCFEEYFVFLRPKDIVSGDFYWMKTHQGYTFMAIVDCTGHGIPGAFMSMVGNMLLNNIICEKNILEPQLILEQLHQGVKETLKQEITHNTDGMDIALCRFKALDSQKYELAYAGAKIPLLIYQQQVLTEIAPTRLSIGGRSFEQEIKFSQNVQCIDRGSVIYVTTDGLLDNPNVKRKKFGKARFRDFILNYHALSMAQQNKQLEKEVHTFQGSTEQRDDMLVLGLKI